MASEVIYTGEQTATLCATCHHSPNTQLPKRPEIPEKAAEVMQALQRAIRVNLGYGRSEAKDRYTPSYSYERDLFQLQGRTRWQAHDYRAGLDATWRRWDFGTEAFYRNFKNDPLISAKAGGDPGYFGTTGAYVGAISFLDREFPLRSRALVTRGSIRGSISDRFQVVRALHNDERMRAPYYELSSGTSSTNANIISRLLVTGDTGGLSSGRATWLTPGRPSTSTATSRSATPFGITRSALTGT